MTEQPPETMQGPVQSAITGLMQHMEIAMWSRGVPPETALEVLNVLMFGDPRGSSAGGTVTSIPPWAEELARKLEALILRSIPVLRSEAGEANDVPLDGDVQLVVLALVRQALIGRPDTFDQVLTP